jgi:hypothetical protein
MENELKKKELSRPFLLLLLCSIKVCMSGHLRIIHGSRDTAAQRLDKKAAAPGGHRAGHF